MFVMDIINDPRILKDYKKYKLKNVRIRVQVPNT